MLSYTLLLFIGAAEAACPFGFTAEDSSKRELQVELDEILYPSQVFQCPLEGKVVKTAPDFDFEDYENIVNDINELYDDIPDVIEPNNNARAAFAGCLVRAAGHDFMDFRYHKKSGFYVGGSDGCINFSDPDNRGLAACLEETGAVFVYQQYCDIVSLADFLVIAGEAVMGRTSTFVDEDDAFAEDTLGRRFRDNFKFGRETVETCPDNVGLMPQAELGLAGYKSIFKDHIFKLERVADANWKQLTAAILGAHTIGSAKQENSGFEGSWTSLESMGVFDNDYYISLVAKGWAPDLAVGGNVDRNQWRRADSQSDLTHKEMMLNSDMALAYDNNLDHAVCMAENDDKNKACKKLQNKGSPILATFGNCCAWTNKNPLIKRGILFEGLEEDYCGVSEVTARAKFTESRETCCANAPEDSYGDCDSAAWPKGFAFGKVLEFAADEDLWLATFLEAWKHAVENGFHDLQYLSAQERIEDGELTEEDTLYECDKHRRKKACTADEHCSWVQVGTNKRGKPKMGCLNSEN